MSDVDLTPTPDEPVRRALARTPARLAAGRAGPAYRTQTWLELRADHAAARDAVHADLDLLQVFGPERRQKYQLFQAQTRAGSKVQYLMRPDLGRRLDDVSREFLKAQCPGGCDFQVVIGDGLSTTAVAAQAPALLDRLWDECRRRKWTFGRPFVVRHCRVGILNDVGDILSPKVVVLLIGERPGLATAESLSAYLAYTPHTGHTDADRNLISNIHTAGVCIPEALARIAGLAARLMDCQSSGCAVKEAALPTALPGTD
jgi:ethanolamine ammonia-lyase small subunit